jgi:hypothetical protein
VQAIDTASPSLARAYDYLLGGRANFAADRALADRLQARYPRIRELLSEARTHTATAVLHLSRSGVDQFVDIGAGLPTRPAVHQAALRHRREASVVYVDRDPTVVSHAAALLPAGIRVIEGDLAEPEALLWDLGSLVDFSRPACLVLSLVLQALDPGLARAVTGVLVKALAPGSHLVLACGAGEAGRLPDAVSGAGLTLEGFGSFLAGLDALPAVPGTGPVDPGLLHFGIGRKP